MTLDKKFLETCEIACSDIRNKAHTREWYTEKDYKNLERLYDKVHEERADFTTKIFLDDPNFKPIENEEYYEMLEKKYPELNELMEAENIFFHAIMDIGLKDQVRWNLGKVKKIDQLYSKREKIYGPQGAKSNEKMYEALKKTHGFELISEINFAFGVKDENRLEESVREALSEIPLPMEKSKIIDDMKKYYKKGKELLGEDYSLYLK